MKLLMLALMWVPVQDRERDVKQEREAREKEKEARAMRMKQRKMKEMREAERARAVAVAQRKLDRRIDELAATLRPREDEAVIAFKKGIATPAGKVVMRDRAQQAGTELLEAAEREIVRKHLRTPEGALKERLGSKLEFFRAYEKQIAPLRAMIREIAAKIPRERGRNGIMRAALEHDAAAHVLYTAVLRRWYRTLVKEGRGGITEGQLAELDPGKPAQVLRSYLVNNLFQKVGDTYIVNSGELNYYIAREIPKYARKKALHDDIDAAVAELEDKDLRDFYSSYLGKDSIEEARKLEFQAVRDRVYDGLGEWADRHFRASEEGRVLKEGARENVVRAVTQIRKVQEGLRNDDF